MSLSSCPSSLSSLLSLSVHPHPNDPLPYLTSDSGDHDVPKILAPKRVTTTTAPFKEDPATVLHQRLITSKKCTSISSFPSPDPSLIILIPRLTVTSAPFSVEIRCPSSLPSFEERRGGGRTRQLKFHPTHPFLPLQPPHRQPRLPHVHRPFHLHLHHQRRQEGLAKGLNTWKRLLPGRLHL